MWMNVELILVFMNVEKHILLNVQTGMHIIGIYHGSINAVKIYIYNERSWKVIQYAQDFQFLNHAYQCLKMNDNISDYVNITDKSISVLTEEKQSGNKDFKNINSSKMQV